VCRERGVVVGYCVLGESCVNVGYFVWSRQI